jgi:uncharacterized protein YbjQ (UPF0145 family)
MIVTTTDFIPGYKVVDILGMVRGNTIRAKHLGKDIAAGLQHMVGGELRGYTEMISESRDQAVDRMIEDAEELGADAIINVRLVTAEVMRGAAEVLAYGTAVKLSK